MLEARRGAWWDADKIGLSPPPIETARGWLVLYHGVRQTATGSFYRLGVALFDLQMLSLVCAGAKIGFFVPKSRMNDLATWRTWCSRAATRSALTATRSTSIMAGQTVVSL
jgi:hypothetical protein